MSQVQAVSCAETQQPDIKLITQSLLNNGFCNERNVEVFVISYSLASLSQFLFWINCYLNPAITIPVTPTFHGPLGAAVLVNEKEP
jgi:hypothetical protein